jgi:pimeloyl-ACP methyl ester carboxylesterase
MNPDTIVLIHGFWVTPRSWEHWKAHYEQQGYRVVTGSPTSAGREDRSIDTRPVTANGTSAEPT